MIISPDKPTSTVFNAVTHQNSSATERGVSIKNTRNGFTLKMKNQIYINYPEIYSSSSPNMVPRQRRAPQKQACSRCAFLVCFSPICRL